jgi:RNA polymerase sigma factor (sigma-70 family)
MVLFVAPSIETVGGSVRMPDSERENLETTAYLLERVREGDGSARDALIRRYLPILQSWARGRLPGAFRDLHETEDLVQISILRALNRVEAFEARREGAFLAYLRQVLLNSIRGEIRRVGRRGGRDTLSDDLTGAPVMDRVGGKSLAVYEEALGLLPAVQQEAVILRVEFGYSFPAIAEAIGSPSPDAARMLVKRAIGRLAVAMNEVRGSGED